MSLFKDMLNAGESLFTNNVEALDFDYIPKLVPFREQEQQTVAACAKPLFQKRNGKNILVYGKPGIGKTVAIKHLLKDLEEQTDDIFAVYVNCWQKNTTYKIVLELCDQLGYKFTQNKKTEELGKIVADIVNKNLGILLVFDEIDKTEDFDFLYTLLEELYRKSVVMITNYHSWLENLDERIKSRLLPDVLHFREYTEQETIEILRQRMQYAFVPDVWEEEAFLLLAKKAAEMSDVRTGLHLLKVAGQHAEDHSQKKITSADAQHALGTLEHYAVQRSGDLGEEEQKILDLVKAHSGEKIGELFRLFTEQGGTVSYKTFQRKIKKLEEDHFVSLEKKAGSEGNTTLVSYGGVKTLSDFE